MDQKIPIINSTDIERIIRRDFPQFEFSQIEEILRIYKSESEKGRNRVYASILKLSNCSIELLKSNVAKANIDFRDIISKAEYPNYSKFAFNDNLPVEKKKQLINDDWTQFMTWLNKI